MIHPVRIGILCWALLWAAFSPCTHAQSLPRSSVWLVALNEQGLPQNPFRVSNGMGYNNQPQFSPDSGTLYFTAEGDAGQTDIWAYDLAEARLRAVNQSPLGDFSPTPIPGEAALSVVRVEADGRQRLWRIDLNSGAEALLFPAFEPVGYHSWISPTAVAMFILGETFDLYVGEFGDKEAEKISENIGRSLHMSPRTGTLFFIDSGTQPAMITALDTETRTSRAVQTLFPGVQDFTLGHDGRLWCGTGAKLYSADPGVSSWVLAADLSEFGVDGITRLDASPDGRWLALVSSP